MKQQQLKIPNRTLRVSHQSEVLLLQKQLAVMEARLNALQKYQKEHMIAQSNKLSLTESVRVALPVDGTYQFVNVADILYVEACGNYSRIYLTKASDDGCMASNILLSKTLKATEQLIGSTSRFIRCHQSYLVNKTSIKGFVNKNGLFVKLLNDQLIAVSRRNKKKVMEACK